MASFDPPPKSTTPLPTIKTVAKQVEDVHRLVGFTNGSLGEFRDAVLGLEREMVELRKRIPRPTVADAPPSSRGPSSNPADVLLAGIAAAPPVTIESMAPAGYSVTPIPPRPSLPVRAAKKSVDWGKVFCTGLGMVVSGLQILDWIGVLPEQMGPLKVILKALLRLMPN